MDILIKNMEMPKDDALSVIIYPDGVAEVQIGWNGDIPVYSNAFNATAIPVPEHGDLIDRDAVLNELKKYYKVGEIAEVGEVACFIDEAEVVLERTT